jgi:hypothetical protein
VTVELMIFAAEIRENLSVVLALVDALVACPSAKLTGQQVDAVIESAVDREHHLTFEIGRGADWRSVEQNAADFAVGLEGRCLPRGNRPVDKPSRLPAVWHLCDTPNVLFEGV